MTMSDALGSSIPQSSELNAGNTFGWLNKLSSAKCACRKKWATRWFVLEQNRLKYYVSPDDKDPSRVLDLKECTDVSFDETTDMENCFRLEFPWRTYYLYASTYNDANDWVLKIRRKTDILRKIYR